MMSSILFRVAEGILAVGTLGHTFGGMIGTAKRGPGSGPEADRVFADMKAVHFKWRGADATWFGFWMGNGITVSALLVPAVVVLWLLGGIEREQAGTFLPLAWTTTASLAVTSAVSVKYFGARVGAVFGLVAGLSCAGALLITLS